MKDLIFAVIAGIVLALFIASRDAGAAGLVAGNATGGTLTLYFEPCKVMPAAEKLERLRLASNLLQRAVGNGNEGEHEACWVAFEPPPGMNYVPIVSIVLQDGTIISEWMMTDFEELR